MSADIFLWILMSRCAPRTRTLRSRYGCWSGLRRRYIFKPLPETGWWKMHRRFDHTGYSKHLSFTRGATSRLRLDNGRARWMPGSRQVPTWPPASVNTSYDAGVIHTCTDRRKVGSRSGRNSVNRSAECTSGKPLRFYIRLFFIFIGHIDSTIIETQRNMNIKK